MWVIRDDTGLRPSNGSARIRPRRGAAGEWLWEASRARSAGVTPGRRAASPRRGIRFGPRRAGRTGGRARRPGRSSARVDVGYLDHRARRARQPVEALGLRESAIGPAVASPAAMRSIAVRCGRTPSGSQSGARARSSASSSRVRAPRNRCGRLWSTMPALKASPRSTRGMTRTIAYSNGLRGAASRGAGTVGLLDEGAWRREPAEQVVHVSRPAPRLVGGARLPPGSRARHRGRGRRSSPAPRLTRGARRRRPRR